MNVFVYEKTVTVPAATTQFAPDGSSHTNPGMVSLTQEVFAALAQQGFVFDQDKMNATYKVERMDMAGMVCPDGTIAGAGDHGNHLSWTKSDYIPHAGFSTMVGCGKTEIMCCNMESFPVTVTGKIIQFA